MMIEGTRNALDCLALAEPDFVKQIADDVLKAYTDRGMTFRIPKKENQQKELAESVAKGQRCKVYRRRD